jgi:dienelactone hydrolase
MVWGAGLLAMGAAAAGPVPDASGVVVQDQRLDIQLDGREYSLAARLYRPAGSGPFPLVVINHGTPPDPAKRSRTKLGFGRAARWFAAQGYAVVLALRPGFGASDGSYLEGAGSCADMDYLQAGRKTAAIEAAIVRSAAALPSIDPSRIIVVGQSAGGFGAVALAGDPPPGVRAVISFAGGRGGNGHDHICGGADRLVAAETAFGHANTLPQLWLSAANDHFFPMPVARRMAQAYRAASGPRVDFVELPAFGDDGHATLAGADTDVWSPAVSVFLARVTAATPKP